MKVRLRTIHLQTLQKMILCNKLRLSNINFRIRISNESLYCCALRTSRNISIERYIKDLKQIEKDYTLTRSKQIRKILIDYIQFNDFNGDEKFEAFKEYIYKKIL